MGSGIRNGINTLTGVNEFNVLFFRHFKEKITKFHLKYIYILLIIYIIRVICEFSFWG